MTPAIERAFEALALVHRTRLYRTALGLCRNPTEAEDLVQETYLRAFRRFDSFVPGTNCLAWLHTILRNVVINHVTRGGREVPAGDACAIECGIAPDAFAERPATPEEEFFRQAFEDPELARALDGLPPSFRAVVLLADVEGCPYREIAEVCELPLGTVMSRLFRARRQLRRALQGPGVLSNGRKANGRPAPGDLASVNGRTGLVVAGAAGWGA